MSVAESELSATSAVPAALGMDEKNTSVKSRSIPWEVSATLQQVLTAKTERHSRADM